VSRRIALACVAGLLVLAVPVALRLPIPGDLELVRLVVSARHPVLTGLIQALTFVSSSVPALILTLVITGMELWRVRRIAPNAAWATLAFLGNAACNIALRVAMGRLPPQVSHIPHLLPELHADWQRFAFPSGHAGAALLAYGALVIWVWPQPRWRGLALSLALLVIAGTGLGRIYLGVHWPTDVLGGYLLAGCWLGIGCLARFRHDHGGDLHP